MLKRRIFVTKILCQILLNQTIEQLMSYIEKCVLLTGCLEVSFSIHVGTGAQMVIFVCFRFAVLLFGSPGISNCHTACFIC